LKYFDFESAMHNRRARLLCPLLVTLVLAACGGSKEGKPSQSLARVNGDEITVLQLNEELQRAGVQSEQQQAASKQLLESLIDRQLLVSEATKEKLDRDPKVVQAIERAKAIILAQAYLQKRIGAPVRPTAAEVSDYFQKNPLFFAQRKQFDMRQLVLATDSLDAAAKTQLDSSKSLDEFAAWLDAHKVKYARAQVSRTSADLPPEMSTKLESMPKGQLFIVREGARSLVIALADIKDAPLTQEAATPQIEQFLFNQKSKLAGEAEVKRLRAAGKIEYLNNAEVKAGTEAKADVKADAKATPPAAPAGDGSNERGVAGLK